MSGFRRRRGSVELVLEPGEAVLLRSLVLSLVQLVAPTGEQPDDPLEAALGITDAASTPDDPALARLLPDAYRDDADQAAEFRRYTERDLREGKVANATAAIEVLSGAEDRGARPVRLDPAQCGAFLGALNDLRLTLGTRLDVSEDPDDDLRQLPPDAPAAQALALYDWLGWLQESLLRSMA